MISPAANFLTGSTNDSVNRFHDEAWRRFDKGVRWSLNISVPPAVAAIQHSDPKGFAASYWLLKNGTFKNFHIAQETFNKEGLAIEALLNSGNSADNRQVIKKTQYVIGLIPLFTPGAQSSQTGKNIYVTDDTETLKIHQNYGDSHFIVRSPEKHPISRVADGLRQINTTRTLTSGEQAIVDFCKNNNM